MSQISFLYKGSLPDGTVFDDGGAEPHQITLGRSQVMPALEAALTQLEVGQEQQINLAPADAYGEYDESAVQKVPQISIPNGDNLPVGQTIMWKAPKMPKEVPVTVKSIENEVVELDFNHPLAGKEIVYWVKVVSKS